MTHFRVDVARDTGEVMLYIETSCGIRPILGWPNVDGMKEFARMLERLGNNIQARENTFKVSDKLLAEALGEDGEMGL